MGEVSIDNWMGNRVGDELVERLLTLAFIRSTIDDSLSR